MKRYDVIFEVSAQADVPEDDEFPEDIRQLIVGRYRVLFTIRKHKVHVLHVRGAHS